MENVVTYEITGKNSNDFSELMRAPEEFIDSFRGAHVAISHVVTAGDHSDVYHMNNVSVALLKDLGGNYRVKMCGDLFRINFIKGKLERKVGIKLKKEKE